MKRPRLPGATCAFSIASIESHVLGLILLLLGTSANAALVTISGSAAFNADTAIPTLVTLNSPSGGTINDLDLFIDFDAACCAYDNTVILSHLDTGTSVAIWFDADEIGAQRFGDVRNTTFDDEAATAFVSAPHNSGSNDIYPGTYRAAELLSSFDGEDFSGSWQLSIQNTGCCIGEGDDLLGWAIMADITDIAPVPVPAAVWLFVSGLLGLVGMARRKTL